NHAPRISTYALTYVYSPGERTTTLHVGGTTQVRVWLNGRLVFEAAPAAGYEWQLFRVPVTFQATPNTLLPNLRNPGGPLDKFRRRVGDNPFDRAWALAECGLRKEAAPWSARGVKSLPTNWPLRHYDVPLWRLHALVLQAAGDARGYAQHCGQMVDV